MYVLYLRLEQLRKVVAISSQKDKRYNPRKFFESHMQYTLRVQNRHHFSFHRDFYKRSPISIIFGTSYIELLCNTTAID